MHIDCFVLIQALAQHKTLIYNFLFIHKYEQENSKEGKLINCKYIVKNFEQSKLMLIKI